MKSLIKLLTAIVLAGAMSSAWATLVAIGINLTGGVTVDTGNITALTATKTINPAGTVGVCVPVVNCATAGIADGDPATFSTGTLSTVLGAEAFTITVGDLVFTFTDVVLADKVATTAGKSGSISLQYDGTITTDPSGEFIGQTASLSQTCTQVAGFGPITCSESAITPGIPVETPEPMSLALVGMGLVALGFIRRKRA